MKLLKNIAVIAAALSAAGCATRKHYNYSYPEYPYYVSSDACGSMSRDQCAWARAETEKIADENAAATWGSVVALTLLASVDVEPER